MFESLQVAKRETKIIDTKDTTRLPSRSGGEPFSSDGKDENGDVGALEQDIQSGKASRREDLSIVFACCLGKVILARRGVLGISQTELARISGLDRSYVSDVERGRRNISLLNLSRLSSALGVLSSDLLACAEHNFAEQPNELPAESI